MDNGAIFSGDSDIGKLISELTKLEDSIGLLGENTGENTKDKGGGSARAKKNPKEEDLLRPAPLNFLIPTGFLILHNDLADILKVLKKSGSGGGGVASTVTAVATSISAATDILNVLKSPAGLGDILNNEEINELLAKDPSVYQIRLAGTKGYLRSYYSDLIAQLGYTYDFQTDTLTAEGSVGSFVQDVMSGMASFFGSAVGSVINSLNNSKAQEEIDSLSEVKEIRKNGYMAYLKAYYADLLEPFGYTMDFTTGGITKGTTVSSAIQNVFQGIGAGLGSVLDNMTSSVNNSVQNIIIESDEDVKAIRKNGYIAYLKAYYADLLQPFGYDMNFVTGEITKSGNITSGIQDVFQGIGAGLGAAINELSDSLNNSVQNVIMESDEDVKNVRKTGYMAYLKAYYNDLLQQFGYEVDFNTGRAYKRDSAVSIFSDAGQALGNFIGGILDGSARGLQNVISESVNDNDPKIRDVRRIGTVAYLKAYYNNLLGEYGYEIDFNTGTSKEKDKSFWEKLKSGASNLGKAIGNVFGGALDSFSSSISGILSADSLKDDPGIVAVKTLGVKSFLEAYFPIIVDDLKNTREGILSSKSAQSLGSSFSSSMSEFLKDSNFLGSSQALKLAKESGTQSFINAYFSALKSDLNDHKGDLFSKSTISGMGDSFSMSIKKFLDEASFKDNSDITAVRTSGVKSFLNAYFTALESDLNNHKGDLFSKSTASSMGTSFANSFNSYINKLSDSVTIDINQSINDSMASSTSTIVSSISRVNDLLFNISNKLSVLDNINNSINDRVSEVKDALPQYIPVPADSGNSTFIGDLDMVKTGS